MRLVCTTKHPPDSRSRFLHCCYRQGTPTVPLLHTLGSAARTFSGQAVSIAGNSSIGLATSSCSSAIRAREYRCDGACAVVDHETPLEVVYLHHDTLPAGSQGVVVAVVVVLKTRQREWSLSVIRGTVDIYLPLIGFSSLLHPEGSDELWESFAQTTGETYACLVDGKLQARTAAAQRSPKSTHSIIPPEHDPFVDAALLSIIVGGCDGHGAK